MKTKFCSLPKHEVQHIKSAQNLHKILVLRGYKLEKMFSPPSFLH